MRSSPFLSASDAARLLSVTAQMVRVWEKRGKLHAFRTAGGIRIFLREDVLKFAELRKGKSRETLQSGGRFDE